MTLTVFPGTGIDSPTDPTSSDNLGSGGGGVGHTAIESLQNDAVVALETKVGVNGSAVNTTLDYKLSGVTTGDKAVSLTGTETLTNKTLTSPKLNDTTALTTTTTELNILHGNLGAWSTWSPTVLAVGGGTATVSSTAGRYIQIGKTVFYRLNAGGSFTGTVVGFSFTVPVTAKDISGGGGYGEINDSIGTYGTNSQFVSTSTVNFINYNGHSMTSGYNFNVSGTYEAA